jgi:hypothetical protein
MNRNEKNTGKKRKSGKEMEGELLLCMEVATSQSSISHRPTTMFKLGPLPGGSVRELGRHVNPQMPVLILEFSSYAVWHI